METSESPNQVVVRNVRRIRDVRGWSQTDLAGACGWSKATQSKIEGGQRRLTVDQLVTLAAALHVAPVWLLVPWSEEDPDLRLVLHGGNLAVTIDTHEAQRWAVGDQPIPLLTDPRDFYWTVPPAQQGRRNELLRKLEEAGVVSFPSSDTVTFHFSGTERTYTVEGDD